MYVKSVYYSKDNVYNASPIRLTALECKANKKTATNCRISESGAECIQARKSFGSNHSPFYVSCLAFPCVFTWKNPHFFAKSLYLVLLPENYCDLFTIVSVKRNLDRLNMNNQIKSFWFNKSTFIFLKIK